MDRLNLVGPILTLVMEFVQAGIDDPDAVLRSADVFGAWRIFAAEQHLCNNFQIPRGQVGAPKLDRLPPCAGAHPAAVIEIVGRLDADGDHRAWMVLGDKWLVQPTSSDIDSVGNMALLTESSGAAGREALVWLTGKDHILHAVTGA